MMILISCIEGQEGRIAIVLTVMRRRMRRRRVREGLASGGGLCRFVVIAIFGFCILLISITNIWFILGFDFPTTIILYVSLLTLSHSYLRSDHKCP